MLKLFFGKVQEFGLYILCALLAIALLYVAFLRKQAASKKIADLERDKKVAERAVAVAIDTTNNVSRAAETMQKVVTKTEEQKAVVRAEAAADIAKIREDAAILRNISRYGGTKADAWNAYKKMKNNK